MGRQCEKDVMRIVPLSQWINMLFEMRVSGCEYMQCSLYMLGYDVLISEAVMCPKWQKTVLCAG
jgi:hypothetical protein